MQMNEIKKQTRKTRRNNRTKTTHQPTKTETRETNENQEEIRGNTNKTTQFKNRNQQISKTPNANK